MGVVLIDLSQGRRQEARCIAESCSIPLAERPVGDFYLALTDERLELRMADEKGAGAIYVDFIGGAVGHRRRFGGGRGQTIARAVGVTGDSPPRVLDATAGLGRDAYVLATLGCSVVLVERSVLVRALLEDGMQRAASEPEIAAIVARMTLLHGDAVEIMNDYHGAQRPDVVYLDPMFPARKKSASVKKEMRFLQQLLEEQEGGEAELLEAGLNLAHKRVVVKRPSYAGCLPGPSPSMAIRGKKHRYDVYVIKALKK